MQMNLSERQQGTVATAVTILAAASVVRLDGGRGRSRNRAPRRHGVAVIVATSAGSREHRHEGDSGNEENSRLDPESQ